MKHIRMFDNVEQAASILSVLEYITLSAIRGESSVSLKPGVEPPELPSNLIITCSENIVTITADNADTIEYNFDGSSNYTTYTQPFEISQDVTVYAKATNNDGSITNSQICTYIDYSEHFYIEDVSGKDNTISIKQNSYSTAITIEKSLNGVDWEVMGETSNTPITATVPANGKLYLRCNTTGWGGGTTSYYNYFSNSTGDFNVGGNIMSLLYGDSFNGQTEFKGNYILVFNNLFNGRNVVSAAKLLLPATTLASDCYRNMFCNCRTLTAAPALPATTLAQGCYNSMFRYCSSLTNAPTLPTTTLAQKCYDSMFAGCTNLNYIKCLATDISAYNCTYNWVDGVASIGTFVKNKSMSSWTTGVNGIPEGWTVEDA